MAFGFGDDAIDDHSDHLVAYWRLEETGAATRVDDVGSNDFTPNNAPPTRAGKNNLACDFDVASQYHLTRADTADVSPTTGMALSFWAYSDASGFEARLFEKQGSYIFWRTGASNTYLVYVYQSNDTAKIISGLSLANAGWRHVVIIAANAFVRCYINNVEQQAAVAFDDTIKDNTNPLYMGVQQGNNKWWDGGCDEVAFWKNISFADQAERDAFVSALYNSGSGRFYGLLPVGSVLERTAAGLLLRTAGGVLERTPA